MDMLTVFFDSCPDAVAMFDDSNRYALHCFCKNRTATNEMLVALLDKCPVAAMSKDDETGCLPLHILCSNEKLNIEMLQALLGRYPEATAESADVGRLPLHILCQNSGACDVQVFRELLRATPDPTIPDATGVQAIAFLAGNPSLTEEVLNSVVELCSEALSEKDASGNCFLHHFAKLPSTPSAWIEKVVIACPSVVEERNAAGKRPLDLALACGAPEDSCKWLEVGVQHWQH